MLIQNVKEFLGGSSMFVNWQVHTSKSDKSAIQRLYICTQLGKKWTTSKFMALSMTRTKAANNCTQPLTLFTLLLRKGTYCSLQEGREASYYIPSFCRGSHSYLIKKLVLLLVYLRKISVFPSIWMSFSNNILESLQVLLITSTIVLMEFKVPELFC